MDCKAKLSNFKKINKKVKLPQEMAQELKQFKLYIDKNGLLKLDMSQDCIQILPLLLPLVKPVKLLKTLNFFNFKVSMSKLDYLKAIAIVAAEILAGLHKTSSNSICLFSQLLISAKRKFVKVKNIQNIDFRSLSIFCSSVMAVSSKFLNLDQCFLKE